MEWLIIIGLSVIVAIMFTRLQALEARMQRIERFDYSDLPELIDEPQKLEEPRTIAPEEPRGTITRSAPLEAPISEELPPPVEREADPDPVASWRKPSNFDFNLPKIDFEDILGRKLPIWAGGIALAVGGIFLVRYSIEAGLLGPQVRVALSFVFGLLLLAGAEAAYRFEERVNDSRVRQALAGAGIATLYAAFYLAGAQYGLIGPGVAFGGLALVTAGALALSFRFGLPTAVLGLVGGFATPMLVASEDANLPVLAFYLALLTAGLALTARRLGYRWLGASALAGGFGWGVLMLLGQSSEPSDQLAIGLYLLALGAALPLILGRETELPFMRIVAGTIATVQLAALVALAEFSILTWGLYLLLAAALAILSWGENRLRVANAMALGLGVVLLFIWPDAPPAEFARVTQVLALIGLGLPLMLVWRNHATPLELAQLSLGAVGLGWANHARFAIPFTDAFQPWLATTLILLAAVVALGAGRLWMKDSTLSRLIALPVAAVAILTYGATHALLPEWSEVIGAAAIALVIVELLRRRHDVPLAGTAWGFAALALFTLIGTGATGRELSYAVGDPYGERDLLQAIARWSAAALPFAALAFIDWRGVPLRIAEAIFIAIAYVALSQFVPAELLAWSCAIAATAALWFLPMRTGLWATSLGLAFLWGLFRMGEWAVHALSAAGGMPIFASDVLETDEALLYVLPFAGACIFATWRIAGRPKLERAFAILAAFSATVVVHSLWKQLFSIDGLDTFTQLGLAERTLWQILLIGSGIAMLRFAAVSRMLGIGLLIAGLAHFAWFTLILHNPLWSEQAVGVLPILNWLAPAYLVAGFGTWWLSCQSEGAMRMRVRQLGDAAIMGLILLWALSELRHAFSGSVLISTSMSQTEDLLRSLTGIVLAIGFLLWGSRKDQRRWRIGSLVLMVLAVLKVFLLDTAGLEDLLRVVSFIALGFSLIGIGWFYSKQLTGRNADPAES
ncbi:DUF2339 domain-containing protein [Aurantiacibacter sediminis]|uniref:DUF2339 domain-containing protein n=1 Tax=Aurantiacibacter sediminis TaxID=2793064 RepID=A0ABS0N420_9SPHN|nr:DUF2339 domain-containing protein [Aurantiacibacter sediminis]MBH5321749.1 DUF2339 domain-containing protein [Aurantiacibacter sediminis]